MRPLDCRWLFSGIRRRLIHTCIAVALLAGAVGCAAHEKDLRTLVKEGFVSPDCPYYFVSGEEQRFGRVLDLSRWKLTLPVDTDRAGSPDEVSQPELASFSDTRSFVVNDAGNGVVFRAHCGASTTKGSKYPRCELREMNEGGTAPAAWATDDGATHTMTMRAAITQTPPVKRHVVCAQIHDAGDDVMMIRLEGTRLFVERNETGDVELDADYVLGTAFDLKIEAAFGRIMVWYDGALKMDWATARSGCYFKAGCYTQSNTGSGEAADSYGEVVVYHLEVEHRGRQ